MLREDKKRAVLAPASHCLCWQQQDHELQRKTGTEGKQTFARAGALLRLVALLTCSHLPLFLLFHDRQQVGASGMCVRKEDVAGASARVSDIRGCVHGALSAQIRELPQTGACEPQVTWAGTGTDC